jgi:hypothetical protein
MPMAMSKGMPIPTPTPIRAPRVYVPALAAAVAEEAWVTAAPSNCWTCDGRR